MDYKDVYRHYEYIARFVDDLIVFSKDPMAVMKELEKTCFIKGEGNHNII